MVEHKNGWAGDERRTGRERRIAVMERAADRREGFERRMNPLSVRFDEAQDPGASQGASQFIPETREPARGLAALGARVKPRHDAHDAIPSLAAIAGHPVHPMLVPLPIGAFVGALAADVAFAATGDRFFARAGRLMTGLGLATGAAAGLSGAVDFIGRGRVRSHPAAWLHLGGNVAVMAVGTVSLALRARGREGDRAMLPGALAMSAVAGALLVVTGWFGGELSYRHRVGVTDAERRGQ
jgi:uncharacterized membrane protein